MPHWNTRYQLVEIEGLTHEARKLAGQALIQFMKDGAVKLNNYEPVSPDDLRRYQIEFDDYIKHHIADLQLEYATKIIALWLEYKDFQAQLIVRYPKGNDTEKPLIEAAFKMNKDLEEAVNALPKSAQRVIMPEPEE